MVSKDTHVDENGNAYLLTWDGLEENFSAQYRERLRRRIARGQRPVFEWSFGARINPVPAGSRVYLLRQHRDRGVLASGRLTTGTILPGDKNFKSYIEVQLDAVLTDDEYLPIDELLQGNPHGAWQRAQASGTEIFGGDVELIARIWSRHLEHLKKGLIETVPIAGTARGRRVKYVPGSTEPVPLERSGGQSYRLPVSSTSREALKREQALVDSFVAVDPTNRATRFKILVDGTRLFTDIHDTATNTLYEAKGVTSRESVRMAIGQLLDYREYISPRPNLSVLLPEAPSPGLVKLLRRLKIGCTTQSAEGSFTRVC